MIRNYIKLSLKVLGRRKFFTFISLFGISLTLVVLMMATAFLDNLFAARAPESRLDRILGVYTVGVTGERISQTGGAGYSFLDKYLRGLPGIERASIFSTPREVVLYEDGRTIDTFFRRTDGAYWQILDHQFLEGGPYTQADDDASRFVAVISEELRARLFGGSPAVGKTVEVDGQRFRVIGVVKSVTIVRYLAFSGVWVPIGTAKTNDYKRGTLGDFNGIVLAKSRGDFDEIRAAFHDRLGSFTFEDKRFTKLRVGLDTTFEAFARAVTGNSLASNGPTVVRTIFLVAALLFVTLPTMNLVSINLSRIMERASEIGVRKAFGASSRALVGQFIVENVVLTVIGGALGFVLTVIALGVMNQAEVIPYTRLDVNFRIFGYGMLLAAAFGIFSGVYPAWRMSRLQAVNALRGGAV